MKCDRKAAGSNSPRGHFCSEVSSHALIITAQIVWELKEEPLMESASRLKTKLI